MDIFHLMKIIAELLPYLGICLANSRVNLNKVNRSRQFLMPFLALIYCIVTVIFLEDIRRLVMSLIGILTRLIPFLGMINWNSIMIYVLNFVLVTGFVAAKAVLLPILNRIWSNDSVAEYTSGLFYEKDSDVDKWFVKKRCANLRGYFKGFYIALIVVTTFIMMLSQEFDQAVFFQAAFYPAFGVLILGEAVFFLSGITRSEFVEDILGEDEESYKVANYGALRELLRNLFGDRVLYENTLDTSEGISDTFDELEEMTASEDPLLQNAGAYFQTLRQNGTDIDINYVKSSVNLMRGSSTLFCNPFYRDLTDYITLPAVKQLISYKKCLVVLGRDSAMEDVKEWIDSSLQQFTGTDSLWQAHVLDRYATSASVGIIKFSDLHNLEIHKANREFLSKVGFVLLVEPSRILSSGQIGLSLLVNDCENPSKDIVYCACDRNCDGLVDALSHILKTSITEVTATISGGANSSQMYWNADGPYMHHKIFPNISRYLGMGTEINAVAMKYQLEQTGWVGSEKFPVSDMKWIAGQYFRQICGYANLPESQSAFNRAFHVQTNLWSSERRENSFLVVEDEFQNLFEMTRLFASRARSQGFVNVISENYFLRDYMLDNVDVFTADPKAIPTIVPDFARTERNMVLKLIMMMVNDSVSEDRIAKELMLCGISCQDPYVKLKELIVKHCSVADPSLSVRFKEKLLSDSLHTTVVKHYEINEVNELYAYAQRLKNAYYIAEDEEGESHYIGAKLYGHVFQAILPGQFITLDGKYYEVQMITPLNGVVVRRAADHITGRRYYRQLRRIALNHWENGTTMGSQKQIADFEIIHGFADLSIATDGYLEMTSYGDLSHAKKISLNGIPDRVYHNKSVLKIRLPESTEKVRCTICLLLNEIFRTTYPDTYHYISAAMPNSSEFMSGELKYAMYQFQGDCDDDCIYIVEDSDIDMGLIVSVERNLRRYLEIISDVLCWHRQKMQETPPEEEKTEEEFVPEFEEKPAPRRKGLLGLIDRIKEFFKGLFHRNKAEKPAGEESIPVEEEPTPVEEEPTPVEEEPTPVEEEPTPVEEEPTPAEEEPTPAEEEPTPAEEEPAPAEEEPAPVEDEPMPAEEPDVTEPEAPETEDDGDAALTHHCETPPRFRNEEEDMPAAEDVDGEDEELVGTGDPSRQTAYQKNCFLKYGFDTISASLDIDGTIAYLHQYDFDQNPLQQVRLGTDAINETTYDPHKYGVHLCDFCGVELAGGEYDVLKDGRERCNRCSMTAVHTVEEFKALYKNVIRNMETFFGIKLNVAVRVRTTNAKQIAKHEGMKFVATPGFDGRVLGFAQKDKSGYSLYIENGSPKLAAASTIAHELTHIWQFQNWNREELAKLYGKQNLLEVYEGMAKWVEVQYMLLLNEKAYAKREEITTRMRDDEYGRGFILYAKKYPISHTSSAQDTPFKHNPPL